MNINDVGQVSLGGSPSRTVYFGDLLVHYGEGGWTPEDTEYVAWLNETNYDVNTDGTIESWGEIFKSPNNVDRKPVAQTYLGQTVAYIDGKENANGEKGDLFETDPGDSPFLAGGSVARELDGLCVIAASQNLPDDDNYGEYGRGSLWGHREMWMNSHAPWQGGNIFFDLHQPFGACRNGTGTNETDCVNSGGTWHPGSRVFAGFMEDREGNPVNQQQTVLVYHYDKSSTTQSIFKNGTLLVENTNTDVTIFIEALAGMRIGWHGFYHRGVLYEFLIYDTSIDTDTRQKAEGYLAHKWGFFDQLDPNHPYRYWAP